MLSRIAVPVVLTGSVLAASPSQNTKLKVKDLPLYGEPNKPELEFHEEKVGVIRQGISVVRVQVWRITDAITSSSRQVMDKYSVARKFGSASLENVREEPAVIQRAALITLAGLGGLVAGYKGGPLRKVVFAATGMVGTASIVYPKQAVDISQKGWERVRSQAITLWEGSALTNSPIGEATLSEKEKEDHGEDFVIEEEVEAAEVVVREAAVPVQEEIETDKTTLPEADHGQSNPADSDMYTTRDEE